MYTKTFLLQPPTYSFLTKYENESNQIQVCHNGYICKYSIITLFTLMQQRKYNQTIVLKLLNLLNYVTFIKTSCQFCSLFPSLTVILFITKRRDKLKMCAPLQTKIGLFTFYSSFIVNFSLFSFSCFSNPRLLALLLHLGVKSTSVLSKICLLSISVTPWLPV